MDKESELQKLLNTDKTDETMQDLVILIENCGSDKEKEIIKKLMYNKNDLKYDLSFTN